MIYAILAIVGLVLALLVAFYVDVYWVRSSDLTLYASGVRWHDGKDWYEVPPTPFGRDVRIEFGHWFFTWLPFMQGYFGANDRVATAPGKIPNAETFCHEVYHACYESIEKGLLYLPWYLTHRKKSEADADAHMIAHYEDEWYVEAARYIKHNRTTGLVGKAA